ncbi:malto-oligosyltrehalose synthase [Stenotrophomonas sp. TWI273]|uniref:malto-oligosyltrehalose synthase n=1 Tax=Stenotrophomonas sp. TWI273 TaxID=3136774 RepID=UPI003208BC32
MTPVRATARLQLHAGFTLADAAHQVDYYARLGISHLYLSPVTRAVPGSTHGYDGVDPTTVSDALGGEPALRALSRQARAHGMGLVLDIVPNHLAAHPDNRWWWDVLAHGRGSRYASWFDIDWRAPGANGRVILPVLDRPLAAALDDAVLRLATRDGGVVLMHHDVMLPLTLPMSAEGAGGDAIAARCAALNARVSSADPDWRALLEAQAYLLTWWRQGDDRLNYRRFFTIASLVALQVQHEDVYQAVHRLPLSLLEAGIIDGLRVDHVDGLVDPRGYLARLRRDMAQACAGRGTSPLLWVEKILAPDESLPDDWSCDGTTGYDFMDQVSAWLHDARGQTPLARHWHRASGRPSCFATVEQACRREVLQTGLRSERDATLAVVRRLGRAGHLDTAAPGAPVVERAMTELLVHFPVYRSYVHGRRHGPGDRASWAQALEAVERSTPEDTALVARQLTDWFWGDAEAPAQKRARDRLRRRIQALSAPLNAKAVEDRAFYRHGVLLSRNEVGSDPDRFALDTAQMHACALARRERHPYALLATATHDHKRGEDARARLAVLSERPPWWVRQTGVLRRLATRSGMPLPPPDVEQMLWQTLVGAWPVTPVDMSWFTARIVQWQAKALREAALHSSWADPVEAVERDVKAFVEGVLLSPRGEPIRRRLHLCVSAVAAAGARNALAQTALRLTLPGVPDLYQGTEGWDLSLVDPDNRQDVDYPLRRGWLDDTRTWSHLLQHWQDGAVKARLVQRLLDCRAQQPALFAQGDYQPLQIPAHVPLLAFSRQHGQVRLLVLVARHTHRSPAVLGAGLADSHCRGAALQVPPGRYRNVLTGATIDAGRRPVRLRTLLGGSPVAIYLR